MVNATEIYGTAIIQGGSTISFDKPVLIEDQMHQITIAAETIRQDIARAAGDMTARETALALLRGEYS